MTRYIIDGYNLLHAIGILIGKVGPRGLEPARTRLLELLASEFGDEAAQVTVVFDAAGPIRNVRESSADYKGIHVEFAVEQPEADDWIEERLAAERLPQEVVVVSSDHRLQAAARRAGAAAMSCTRFLDHMESRRRPPQPDRTMENDPRDGPSPAETERWLKEFAGLEKEPDLEEALKPFDFEFE